MTELDRWQEITQYRLQANLLQPGQIPGYLAPTPKTITTFTDRPGGGGTYWSFQTSLQRKVQGLVGMNSMRNAPDAQISELLDQDAGDSVAWLGNNDPDCEQRGALVPMYVQLFRFGVTPI
jgi:hypothetical protein